MEKLAREGVKFTQAYACAVCSPSRISLMTGLNAARHKVTNWTLRKNKSPDWEDEIIQPPDWNMNGMSLNEGIERTVVAKTLPQLLHTAGYRTIHVGKAHFGAKGTPGENPLNLGFDVNIAGHAPGGPGSYLGKNNFSAAWRNADRIWDVPGLEKYHGQDIFLTEALTIEAISAIEEAVELKKPFYLYMSHYAIHAPWEIDNRFFQKYIDKGLSEFQATYAAMIEGMDKSLGDLVATLSHLGIEENTIIVFMSDNGQPKQAVRNRPLKGHKLLPYEGGIRVPLLVKWPGKTKVGTVCVDYVIIEDIFPTFLEMAGIEQYSQIGGVVDGQSFVPLLKGDAPKNKQRPIFWHYPHTYDQPPYSAVRKGDWKLIYHHKDRRLELFNLANDISEAHDLSVENREKLMELVLTLSHYLRESGALMPIDKRTGKAVEYPNELSFNALSEGNK
jgi:arylsulfatase A-like enzyme